MRNLFLGAVAGATAAYFYLSDAREGARRRAAVRERLSQVPGLGGFVPGTGRGEYAKDTDDLARSSAAHRDAGVAPIDDMALAQKVRSEIFEDVDIPRSGINVNAERGVVVLRGQVETAEEIDALDAAVRRVDGVRDVDNRLHLPGVPGATGAPGGAGVGGRSS